MSEKTLVTSDYKEYLTFVQADDELPAAPEHRLYLRPDLQLWYSFNRHRVIEENDVLELIGEDLLTEVYKLVYGHRPDNVLVADMKNMTRAIIAVYASHT